MTASDKDSETARLRPDASGIEADAPAQIRQLEAARQALLRESKRVETLNRVGQLLTAELDLEKIVQAVTDAGVELTGAKFGAFFYNVHDRNGESLLLYSLSGASREDFSKFPHPRATAIFAPTFEGTAIVRSDDIKLDPRYGLNDPYFGMPAGHLPLKSYLAVPVVSRSGEVIGGLFFGHPDPARFTETHENLLVGIASHAAVAVDNARLYQAAQREVAERKRAEEALRDSRASLVQLADSIPQIVWQSASDGRVLFLNRQWEAYTGVSVDTAIEEGTWTPWMDPDDLERISHAWLAAIEGRSSFSAEARMRRADGAYRWFLIRATPQTDEDTGEIVRWFGTSTDIHDARLLEEERRQLAAIVEQSSDFIGFIDGGGRARFLNEAARRMIGVSMGEAAERTSVLDYFAPAEREEITGTVIPAVLENGWWEGNLHLVNAATGVTIPVRFTVFPVRDSAGLVMGYGTVARDITEQRKAETQRELLTGELAHRVKNTLAMVQAIAGQTFRQAGSLAEARDALATRLQVLGHAHDSLTRSEWSGASIRTIVEAAVAPHSGGGRFSLAGPDLRLNAGQALGLSLALHELATNAVKYGALSNDTGTVDINWSIEGDGEGGQFHFRWSEAGGPPVVEPEHRGFGSRMIERTLSSYFLGEASIRFDEQGVVFGLDAPLRELQS